MSKTTHVLTLIVATLFIFFLITFLGGRDGFLFAFYMLPPVLIRLWYIAFFPLALGVFLAVRKRRWSTLWWGLVWVLPWSYGISFILILYLRAEMAG